MASATTSRGRLRQAEVWLARHDLAGARPTPLLAARLTARAWVQIGDGLVLGALVVVAALVQVGGRRETSAWGGHQSTLLLVLLASVVVLLLIRSLLEGWIRRVDRRAAALLSRRAALPVQPHLRALLGRPYAAFAVCTFTGGILLTVSAFLVGDSTTRYAAVIVLVGLVGVGVGTALRLRYLLARPVVADDEESLTADVVMRVDDARDAAAPTVLWTLPMVLLFGTAPHWWEVASIAFVCVGLLTLALVNWRAPASVTVARRAMAAR